MLSTLYYGWWVVLACFMINLYVGGVIYFSFTAFFEPIQQEFGWSHTQISIATSLRGLEMGIFAPIFFFVFESTEFFTESLGLIEGQVVGAYLGGCMG